MHNELILAGFGGQGVLLIGKLLAYAGMKAGLEVTWMPAYGPGDARRHLQLHGRAVGPAGRARRSRTGRTAPSC